MSKMTALLAVFLVAESIFWAWDAAGAADDKFEELAAVPVAAVAVLEEPATEPSIIFIKSEPEPSCETPEPEPAIIAEEPPAEEPPFSDEEVEAITQTLSGECYDDKLADKRRVVEVIVNRVSDGGFGDGVVEVVTARRQFRGYWNPSRPVSESDVLIAKKTLRDWYANDCQALSEYLFFSKGPNRENVFRAKY
jgi:hypothetical protein